MDNNLNQDRIEQARIMLRNMNTQNISQPKTIPSSSGGTELNKERVELARKMLREGKQTNPEEYSYGERALQVGRGMANTVGSVADIASHLSSPAVTLHSGISEKLHKAHGKEFNEQPYEEIVNKLNNPKAAEYLTGKIDELSGRNLEPTDTTGKLLHTAGEFLTPIPGISGYGPAVKQGIKTLGKHLAKEISTSGGASAALHLTPTVTEEGTTGRTIEDLAKTIFGGKAGSSLISPSIAKTTKKADMFNKGKGPNKEVLDIAKREGIELPFNVGMNSRPLNFLANNYLKSMFISDSYKNVLNKSNDSMINSVKKSIDTLGNLELKPSEVSNEYKMFLKSEEKQFEKEASKYYEEASSLLKPTDKVVPKNTIESIESMRELLTRDIKSPATKKVSNIIGKLAESWGILPPDELLKEYENHPELIEKILDSFKNKPVKIPVEKLIGIRKELGTITNYDPDIKGVEAYLRKIRSDITKDIESSKNTEFVSKQKEANKFFKENVADRFRSDISRSLMTGEVPTEAFNLMTTPENIKFLEKISGNSEKGKEIFNALKKAKVRDIFSNAFQEDRLMTGAFSRLFNKKEKGQELLETLLGKTEYNKLSDISKISDEFNKSGRELLNTSGTAIAATDIEKLEKSLQATFSALRTLTGGSVGYAASGIGGAALGIASPYLISKLVSNPKFVNQMRAYAIARNQGKEVYANTILKRLISLSNSEAKMLGIKAYQDIEEQKND